MRCEISRRTLFKAGAASMAVNSFIARAADVDDPHVQHPIRDIEMIRSFYGSYAQRVVAVRKAFGRPLTLSEKILFTHLFNAKDAKQFVRGKEYANFRPDRLIMQDPLGLTALQQFLVADYPKTMLPSSLHADHLIVASKGAKNDLAIANEDNAVIYKFLKDASDKLGIDFWEPGSGIIHQQTLENYSFPGCLIVGCDSHTPNGSALSGMAIGIGGADAVDCMSGVEWEVLVPRVIGVKLTGKLQGWTTPKDVILKLLGMLTVKGGTNAVIEYFGEGVESLSATGKGTIANMGAELGATSSVFPYDARIADYLRLTGRAEIAQMATKVVRDLRADPEVYADPKRFYDQVIEIDLSSLEPQVSGPFSPDATKDLSSMRTNVAKLQLSDRIEAVLIGSCTNSSYEDISRAAELVDQAYAAGLKLQCPTFLAPGSNLIKATMDRDGLTEKFERLGVTILANACGPCCGMWKRDNNPQRKNTIVTTFNRNFRKRNDLNPLTEAFLVSPDLALAYAFSGSLSFNPITDTIKSAKGEFRFTAAKGYELPPKGYAQAETGCITATFKTKEIKVDPNYTRLQPLAAFAAWDGKDPTDLPLLIKAKGKCTTDHITPAGKWVAFYGNLKKLSENTFSVAENAFHPGKLDSVYNHLTGKFDQVWKVATDYKNKGMYSIVVADENYGEGSSREQAAMQPRFLNVEVVVARSYARIHETNLKKQGILALTFANPKDYDKVREKDRITIEGVTEMKPGTALRMVCRHEDGTVDRFTVNHSYNERQIEWFRYGSALNMLREKRKSAA